MAGHIYYLHPLVAGPLSSWPRWFSHAVTMGFDGVCIAPPFCPAPGGDIFTTSDHERLHPALGWSGDADSGLAYIASEARHHGLKLYVDLVLDRVADSSVLVHRIPDGFQSRDVAVLPDPRQTPRPLGIGIATFERTEATDALVAWWTHRLSRLLFAGVSGFRCLHPDRVPAAVWRRLTVALAAFGRCEMLAWTPGLAVSALRQLEGAGFTATAAATAWWDEASGRLADEITVQRRIGPIIATVEPSWTERLAAQLPAGADFAAAYRHRLAIAHAIGDSLFVTMGFEYAARRGFDSAAASPADFETVRSEALVDLTADIAGLTKQADTAVPGGEVRLLTTPGDQVTAWLRHTDVATLTLINRDLARSAVAPFDLGTLPPYAGGAWVAEAPASSVLAPGEVRPIRYRPASPVRLADGGQTLRRARIAIETLAPIVAEDDRLAAKCVVGDHVVVSADIIADGHDVLAVEILWRPADEKDWRRATMQLVANDRWEGTFQPGRVGLHHFTVEAWWDEWGTFRHDLAAKSQAGVATELEQEEGRRLLAKSTRGECGLATVLQHYARADNVDRIALLLSGDVRTLMRQADPRAFAERHPVRLLRADRQRALFGGWYELFPRSESDQPGRHGTLRDVIRRLPAIRDMGFDVLYFPPIHPIGRINRKGRNNAREAVGGDVGSPYAIGSREGGHEAIHPELGTLADFRALVRAAAEHGLEIALDFAIQCAPDHPWLREHPDWFRWRPDGSMRYAENPPKKYEDIVNPDFFAEAALPPLWIALRDIVLHWIAQGVRIFRVDNPHTKPLPFWQWMIADVQARDPNVIFLAEAFTRPKLMYRLAKVGFTQSYTYFTWRNTKAELTAYIRELTASPVRDFFRPNFFVNTPDINPFFLQSSGRAGFVIRAVLAATLSGSWGMYSGFEICESAALAGREEYLDAEKYEIRQRDYAAPGNITDIISELNHIRRANPALQSHLGIQFYDVHDDQVLLYGKRLTSHGDMILVAVSLDPFNVHDCAFDLPLWEFGLPDDGAIRAIDLMRDVATTFQGKWQRITLTPEVPFALWRIGVSHG